MTEQEALSWKQSTQQSKFAWKMDKIHRNPKDLLCYQGENSGQFVHIRFDEKNYRLDLGTFMGSLPDAQFTVMGKRHFSNFPEVVEYLEKRVGVILTK